MLRIHDVLPASRANGPGRRAVVWVQGCTLGCPGCFNPETHDPDGGQSVDVDALFRRIATLEGQIEGLSISGGEPLQQPRPLLRLLQRVRRETTLSVLLFTGYTWEEIQGMAQARPLLACVDVLVAGRYDPAQRLVGERGLRSSANQTVHRLGDRYTLADLHAVPPGEVILSPDGGITLSGVDPLHW